ncbi:3-deoxy-manno-octulosonate cytidylyltransferase [Sulfurovum sp. zt1-1]|uniref:3-deoxy-manno-octulosonate cytidylyltransferase n=1 Tax=Sulfurovum zhangzhouensis TaxID=3019067 RepID=A0ABT7QW02_9BACT|nr:3-deoxy-manno-octulosonate cytidylyltransferase [Sulfurovum zhangzhouensis]MDM5271013.1 3-deoxy-manno-octulosonate cytidylyltransferase [Sulfurovum zhangzhouensis]
MIIIPARIGSSRFPNKVLADIGGVPMVIRTAKAVQDIDDVCIATDSQEVIDIAREHDIKAIMTSQEHQSGTDRIYEAAVKLGLSENEIIINVQGDEPFIETDVVRAIFNLTRKNRDNEEIMMNSCYKKITNPEADDPNIVKVVTDTDDIALYFSRAKIPYPRDHHFDEYKGHLGIYGFTMYSLKTFCNLKDSSLEHIEKLEQLRALYHGYKVAMIEVKTESFGIDTPEDLERAIKHHRL